jgi:predicted outer membrane repeat protein
LVSLPEPIRMTDSTFSYNTAGGSGGAIYANGNDVTSLRSTFDHNTALDGGGGAIDNGAIAPSDSVFTNNKSKGDGGAFNSEGEDIQVRDCTISGNTATNGVGGGFADEGNTSSLLVVRDSTISGNTAGGDGGGFTATGATLSMSGCTISGNRSGSDGGGVYIATTGTIADMVDSSIVNCTIANNGSATDGGGIDFEGDGDLTIINATIAFNSSFNGGGLAQTDGAGTIHIGNTIVAKNNAPNGPDAYNTQAPFDDLGHNLVFSDPDMVFTNPGNNDIFNKDPLLKPLANNGGPTQTLALSKHSPAENTADGSLLGPNPTDQRGVKRPRDGGFDIGAYESK